MISKMMVFVIATIVAGGIAAGITTIYVLHPSGGFNSSENVLSIKNHYYFFGSDPSNPFRETTYIYMQLSDKLLYNDFVHFYVGSYDLARWWVNRTQAYHTEISVPLDRAVNLNGSVSLEIKRGTDTLFNGILKFITEPKITAEVGNVAYKPLNYKYAEIDNAKVNITTSQPIYLNKVYVTVENYSGEAEIGFLDFQKTVSVDIVGYFHHENYTVSRAPDMEKGSYNITVSVSYSLFPSGSVINHTEVNSFNLNFTCHNVSVTGAKITRNWYETVITFNLNDSYQCPYNAVFYTYNHSEIGNVYVNDTFVNVSLSQYFNFNGSYTLVLKDYFGNVMDSYPLSLHSGPLELVNHTEERYNESWHNQTYIQSITLTLKNEGDQPAYLTNYNCSAFYASNNTLAAWELYTTLYEVINASEQQSFEIAPYFHLPSNQTYTFVISFWGDNEDVKYIVSFQIRT